MFSRKINKISRNFFAAQHGRGCSSSSHFPTSDVSIRSRDIRYENRKLSEIVPNFGSFFSIWSCFVADMVEPPKKHHSGVA